MKLTSACLVLKKTPKLYSQQCCNGLWYATVTLLKLGKKTLEKNLWAAVLIRVILFLKVSLEILLKMSEESLHNVQHN